MGIISSFSGNVRVSDTERKGRNVMQKPDKNRRKSFGSEENSYKSHQGISKTSGTSTRMDAAEEIEGFDPEIDGFDYDKNKFSD